MPDVIHGPDRRPSQLGRTLFDYADEVSAAVPQSCRRSGRCRECVVEVRQGLEALSPRTEAEAYLPEAFRLACQARIDSEGADVEFAIIRRRIRILGDSDAPLADIDPLVTVDAHAVRYDGIPIDLRREHVLGLAIDVGTTTVAFHVVDLLSGRIVGGGALENPQRFGGSDVMSRISYERDHPGTMRAALRRALNHTLRDTYSELGIDRHEVYEAMVVANSTMRDLFFDLDISPIGEMPYKSTTELAVIAGGADSTWLSRRAHQVGLLMHPHGRVVGAPIIASHVGGDVAADLVATDFAGRPGVSMLVDIGTNTEVVVSDGGTILAASCPAGPAFEGGLLRFGMPGADGAIESVHIDDGRFRYRTIGDVEPQGICGSGLVDILAELRRVDWMSPEGRFADGLDEYIVAAERGISFSRSDASLLAQANAERGISFSRSDASLLAQAKAANACGQRILLRRLGVSPDQVDRVFLAGGFANAIDVDNAIAIGFLAPVPAERVVRVGNSALRGAAMLLLSRHRRLELDATISRITHMELETEADFFELFVDGCQFMPLVA